MIDVIKRTPQEYSKQSRDYQIIARLYSALFNVSKVYIDNTNIWNRNIDNRLTQLRATTLNFDAKHAWDLDDLEAVTSCFKYLVREKGTIEAIKACIYILMKIKKIDGEISEDNVEFDKNEKMLIIKMERNLLTWGIMEDLMKYILPCGINYRLIEESIQNRGAIDPVELEVWDFVYYNSEGYTSDLLIGHNVGDRPGFDSEGKQIPAKKRKGRVNYITETYIYSNSEGKLIPDFKEEGRN